MEQQERDPKVIAEFKRRRKRQIASFVAFLVVVVVWVLIDGLNLGTTGTRWGLPRAMVLFGFTGIGVAYGVMLFKNWRCPRCNRFLKGGFNPNFCPNCGVPFA